MPYVHLYPYSPRGWYGGTLRLRTAMEGTVLRGQTAALWFDISAGAWHEIDLEAVGAHAGEAAPVTSLSYGRATSAKRCLFPSALWESGIRPRRKIVESLAAFPGSIVVLHTTYLAPVVSALRVEGHRAIVDAHDVVFRAHEDDAAGASQPLRAVRAAYSATVRKREIHALRDAEVVLTAGWNDAEILRDAGLGQAKWAPTGLDVTSPTEGAADRLRVGVLGNFAHSATIAAAVELLNSPLGVEPDVEIVFAGMNSHRLPERRGVVRLGPIRELSEFYSAIDASVVPVSNGSGMKCKLAEAALAGRAIITTPLGAAGYPAELRDAMTIVDGADQLNRDLVRTAIGRTAPDALRGLFQRWVGRSAAAERYAAAIDNVS